MKKMIVKGLVLSAITFGLYACVFTSPETDDGLCNYPPNKAISKEAEPYFNFPIGSYWVYQDSLFHEAKDTFRLIANKRVFDDGTQNAYYADCPQNGLYDNWKIAFKTDKKILYREDTLGFELMESSVTDTSFYRFYANTFSTQNNLSASYNKFYTTKIGDKEYSCVKENWFLDTRYYVYRAKNIGIVKIYDERNHKTWELDTFYIAK